MPAVAVETVSETGRFRAEVHRIAALSAALPAAVEVQRAPAASGEAPVWVLRAAVAVAVDAEAGAGAGGKQARTRGEI